MSTTFSIIFFLGFVACSLIGIYAYVLDRKNTLNRLFSFACLCLSVWLFSFSIANSAVDLQTALFWRRVAAIGWGFIYAVFFNYILVFTNCIKKNSHYKSFLIYLPALIVTYSFSFGNINPNQYNLVKTSIGWVNVATSSFWDIFFYIYYILYLAIGLLLLAHWNSENRKKDEKIESYMLIASFIGSSFFGSFTDIVVNTTPFKLPQIGGLLALLPVLAVFISIKNYGLMKPKENIDLPPNNLLGDNITSRMYKIVAFTYFLYSAICFLVLYFVNLKPLSYSLSFSILNLIIGVLILLIDRFIQKDKIKSILFTLLVCISAPAVAYLFNRHISVTSWVIPATLIFVSIVYNKLFLYSLSISVFISQIFIWIKQPNEVITLTQGDFYMRLAFYVVIFVLAIYINRVYWSKLKENDGKVELQKIISNVSAAYIKAEEDTIDDVTLELLRRTGTFFKSERVFIFQISGKRVTHEWCQAGVQPFSDYFPNQEKEKFTSFIMSHKFEKISEISDVVITKNENGEPTFTYNSNVQKALYCVPLRVKNNTIGFLCFINSPKNRIWNVDYQHSLDIVANLISDSNSRLQTEKHILHLAYHDSLSNLPNIIAYKEHIDNCLHGKEDLKAFMVVNYKDFKLLNLTMGSPYSDSLIKKTASILENFLSDFASIFHISIDRFAICFHMEKSQDELLQIAYRIIGILQSTFTNIVVRGNIGIVDTKRYQANSDTLLKYAYIAADSVKDNNLWDCAFFSPEMESELERLYKLEQDIKRIVNSGNESQELYLNFQPVVDLKTEKIVSFEVLARLHSKTLGFVSPIEFIPIAEKSNMIYQVGYIVIAKTLQFVKKLENNGFGDLKAMINISAIQFLREEFLEDLFSLISVFNVNPKMLGIELTESVFTSEYAIINEKLGILSEKGIEIAIDDFGTGYSSFARERELNVQCIKIDKYFLDNLNVTDHKIAITGDIISMAHKLGHKVVAEGVENIAQKQYLIEHNCDYMQGYLFSKPVSEEQALELLMKQ